MSESEAKQATGTLQKISADPESGWHTFEIDIGGQWPLKIKTKHKEIIDAAIAYGRKPGAWHYTESEGNPNPHRPGTNYINRYLNKVEEIENDPNQVAITIESSPETVPVTQQEKTDWPLKDAKIVRQSCLKAAAWIYTGKNVAIEEVIGTAAAFEEWVNAAEVVQAESSSDDESASSEAATEELPEGFDDSIPF